MSELTTNEQLIVNALKQRKHTVDSLVNRLYSGVLDGGPDEPVNCVRVFLNRIAKKGFNVHRRKDYGNPTVYWIVPMYLDKLKADLARDEDFVSHAYQDSEGYWTIGIGRLIDKRRGGGITREEAEYLLENDLKTARADLDAIAPWWTLLPDDVQRGLMNMAFQLGRTNLSEFKKTFAALKARDYNEAGNEALRSRWAEQTPARARRVAKLIRSG